MATRVPCPAFWAGFGAGVWVFDYNEGDVFSTGSNVDATFDEINLAGNIFVEIDYKIADVFHLGFGLRWHGLLAEHTDEGRFYDLNGVSQSVDTGRNDGNFDDVAQVWEMTFNLSVLF